MSYALSNQQHPEKLPTRRQKTPIAPTAKPRWSNRQDIATKKARGQKNRRRSATRRKVPANAKTNMPPVSC
jgi:hypothetical protein